MREEGRRGPHGLDPLAGVAAGQQDDRLEEALRLLAAEATAPDLVRAQVGEGEGRLAAE